LIDRSIIRCGDHAVYSAGPFWDAEPLARAKTPPSPLKTGVVGMNKITSIKLHQHRKHYRLLSDFSYF